MMITYEAIRAIACKDNEEYPDNSGLEGFEVEDDAAVQFAQGATNAYAPRLLSGEMGIEQALTYSCLVGIRMGLLIARELNQQAPDVVPQEWSA
jgi:hypothetical protein